MSKHYNRVPTKRDSVGSLLIVSPLQTWEYLQKYLISKELSKISRNNFDAKWEAIQNLGQWHKDSLKILPWKTFRSFVY